MGAERQSPAIWREEMGQEDGKEGSGGDKSMDKAFQPAGAGHVS